ncbi:hypothetical protein AYR62_01015 [Secundilactobacillus paracollinoides]|uniref:Uncharacterized protein n=1 Tax=Secundilactobacillus paracollinoides TaxID=240427 RepID=A0A1B2IVG7_9LACO|nr:hypothetical protein [Secundilactobacillus paracollinoides]ANZ60226.1 hypothetical protein AYR61_01905 [Secundilactobacillus paracollinoides]ANZ62819.1 hypothetical protein AYR62_01015 [Secundilactobacillus paracollinoides]ANZ66021.1 hypothetical protein AYR63_01925 [Secundilactobacillus paracollinoides]
MHTDNLYRQLIPLIIKQIEYDYATKRIDSNLHAKSRTYLSAHNVTYEKVLFEAVTHLEMAKFFRGPHAHHWLKNTEVFEFVVYISQIDFYVKFDVREGGTLIESFHPTEKMVDDSWIKLDENKGEFTND